jgi:hypothetical protein
MLTKEQILSANDLPTQVVNVPEWNGSVIVKTMTGLERDSFEESMLKADKKSIAYVGSKSRLCVRCIVDDSGKRIFSDEDAEALGKKSAPAINRIYDVAARINGINKEDIDELEKNSETGQNDDSISD